MSRPVRRLSLLWGADPKDRADTAYGVLVVMILMLGAFLRLNRYLLNRSLWLDETYFARNIIERAPLELVGTLSYSQHSPSGFTLAVKLLTMVFGAWEPVLRFIPLMVALASLPLFYLLARRWLPRWAALLALLLFAASDALGEWAAQFEKYSVDVMMTLLVLLVAVRFYESGRRSRLLLLAIVGAVAVWFSYSVTIVLAGIGLVLFFDAVRRRAASEAVLVGVVACGWLASFYVSTELSFPRNPTVSRTVSQTVSTARATPRPTEVPEEPSPSIRSAVGFAQSYRNPYWAYYDAFLTFPPTTIAQVEDDIAILTKPLEDPAGFALYSGVVLLYGVGAIEIVRKGGSRWFVLAPILVAVVLSAVGFYPFYGRFILFAVPLLVLTVVMGIARLEQALTGRTERVLALLLLGLVVFQPLRHGLARGLRPRELEETRPLMIHLSREYRPADAIALYYGAQSAYAFYAAMLGFDQAVPSTIKPHPDAPEDYCKEIEPLVGSPRVWILFSHTYSGRRGSEEAIIVDCLDQYGLQRSKLEETGASLYLYDLSGD